MKNRVFIVSDVKVLAKLFDCLVDCAGPVLCFAILELFYNVNLFRCLQLKGAISSTYSLDILGKRDLSSKIVLVLIILETRLRCQDKYPSLLHKETIFLSQLASFKLLDLLNLICLRCLASR